MASLHFDMFGGFALRNADGASVTVSSRKISALAAYLAVTAKPQSRDTLAGLLWGDSSDDHARTSLRQALTALRRALGDHADVLQATQTTVELDATRYTSDVAGFETLVRDGTLASLVDAAGLYRGPLLDGVQARAEGFDEWLAEERQRLKASAIAALYRGGLLAEQNHDWSSAARLCDQVMRIDPFHEDGLRCRMRVAALSGRRTDALGMYETFAALLRREFGLLPQDDTTALSAQIRAGALVSTPDPESAPVARDTGSNAAPELRQATALVIEIEDFTNIASHLPPEEAADFLNRYFSVVDEAILSFGGTITDHVADSAMALFGMIEAHEDDADRALAAAMAIREGCRAVQAGGEPVELRMAIATGQVLSAQVGSVHFRQHTATGEAVNLAWWSAQNAPPDAILVAEETHQALRQAPPMTPADLSEPVPGQSGVLWQVLGATEALPVDDRRPFVGRRLEQRQIESLVEACQEREMGNVLVIRGEAGIGKSRLVDWTIEHAHRHGFGVNAGQVFDFGAASSRHVIRSLVLDLLDVPRDADAATRRAAIKGAIAQGLVEPPHDVLIANLFDLPMDPEDVEAYDAMGSEARFAARKLILASLVTWRVGQNPVMIVIEDVHWADDVTLKILADFAASLRDCASLFVMTTRTDNDPIDARWRVAAGGVPVTTIDLGPLSARESEILAQPYATGGEAFLAACVARAAGHPLFLDQLLANPDLGQSDLPPSIRSIVLAKLDRIDADDRRALQAAAVLGQQFWTSALQHLIDDDSYETTRLLASGLVAGDGKDFRFSHAMVQEAIVQSLLPGSRRSLHLKAAQWFAERDLTLRAEHLAWAEDSRAAAAFLDAAREQVTRLRYQRAMQLVERGLELAGNDDAGAEALPGLNSVHADLTERLGTNKAA